MDKLIKSGSGVKGILILASGLILGLIESNLENATVLQLVSPHPARPPHTGSHRDLLNELDKVSEAES